MTKRKWPQAIQKLQQGLADPDAAGALAGVLFDYLLDQPVATFVAPDRLLGHLDRILDEALTEPWVEAHLKPGLARERERSKTRGDVVGDWLTAEAKAELRSLAAKPVRLNRRFLEGLVKQDAVHHMLRSIIQETLDRFVTTVKPGGDGGGIAGSVGRGVLGAAKRAGLGGIGAQVEAQMTRAVYAFVQGSMNLMLERLVVILSSPETATQFARTNLGLYDKLMATPTGDLLNWGDPRIGDDIAEALPGVLAHNLAREEVRAGIREEVAAWLAIEGEKPLSGLFASEAAIAALRAEVVEIGGPLVSGFGADARYLDWLAEHS